jgi:hypothetical protein
LNPDADEKTGMTITTLSAVVSRNARDFAPLNVATLDPWPVG